MFEDFSYCPLCRKEKHVTQLKRLSDGRRLKICKKCFRHLKRHVFKTNKRCKRKKIKGRIQAIDWALLLEHFKFKCVKCKNYEKDGKKYLTMDHIVPVSKGGKNVIKNIQPMCKKCNWKKSNNIEDYRDSLPVFASPIIRTKPLTGRRVGATLTLSTKEMTVMDFISKLELVYSESKKLYGDETKVSWGEENFPRKQWWMTIGDGKIKMIFEAPTLKELFDKVFLEFEL